MIIDYDHNPALSVDQKLQSLQESVQMALNEEPKPMGAVNYNDLINKPTIPTSLSDLTNDMTVSDFPNDAGYLTQHQDISGKANKVDTDIDASVTTLFASLGWVQD